MKFESILDNSSTAGNFFGFLSLDFNATDDYSKAQRHWKGSQILKTLKATDNDAEVEITFTIGEEGAPDEFYLSLGIKLIDPRIPNPQFEFGNAPLFFTSNITPGTRGKLGLIWQHSSGPLPLSNNDGKPPVGVIAFDFLLPVEFDGAIGIGFGRWSLKYDLQ